MVWFATKRREFMLSLTSSWKSFAVIAVCSSVLPAQVPSGWGMAGSRPADYDCSIDPASMYQGQASVYLKSKPGVETTGFGTMSQYFGATQYAGKRVRFSANIKAEGVDPHGTRASWAGLWLRVDGENHKVLVIDNMHQTGTDRAITGTRNWQNYSVVLDVAENATGLGMGILLDGAGAVWISGIKFEVVGTEVPVTVTPRPAQTAPANLGFEK
jgi:hypothetical protein